MDWHGQISTSIDHLVNIAWQALSVQEMDRLGNYLATKFGLSSFRLNDDVRSSTRSVSISKMPGCDNLLVRPLAGRPCDGWSPAACRSDAAALMLPATADPTDDYYKGMRLSITGGGDSTDGRGVKSAAGQSCLVTAYDGSSKLATCDMGSLGSAWVLWTGNSFPPPPGYEAVTALDTNLTVTWVPSIPPPYYALLGDPAGPRGLVKVISWSPIGPHFQLTVQRASGAGIRSAVSLEDANRLDGHLPNMITYSRSALVGEGYPMSLATTGALAAVSGSSTLPGAATIIAANMSGFAVSSPIPFSNLQVPSAPLRHLVPTPVWPSASDPCVRLCLVRAPVCACACGVASRACACVWRLWFHLGLATPGRACACGVTSWVTPHARIVSPTTSACGRARACVCACASVLESLRRVLAVRQVDASWLCTCVCACAPVHRCMCTCVRQDGCARARVCACVQVRACVRWCIECAQVY